MFAQPWFSADLRIAWEPSQRTDRLGAQPKQVSYDLPDRCQLRTTISKHSCYHQVQVPADTSMKWAFYMKHWHPEDGFAVYSSAFSFQFLPILRFIGVFINLAFVFVYRITPRPD